MKKKQKQKQDKTKQNKTTNKQTNKPNPSFYSITPGSAVFFFISRENEKHECKTSKIWMKIMNVYFGPFV